VDRRAAVFARIAKEATMSEAIVMMRRNSRNRRRGLGMALSSLNSIGTSVPTDVVWGDLSSFVVAPQVVDGSIESYINPRSHPA
jgi:hypothetical protein